MKIIIVSTDGPSGGGGVGSVVRFVTDLVSRRRGWEVEVAVLQMSFRAPESRRLLAPASWFGGKRVSHAVHAGITVHRVGASLAELEPLRFLPRRWLTSLLETADVVVVVAGSPALALAVGRSAQRVVMQVATLIRWERESQVRGTRGAARLYRRLMRRVMAQLDAAGAKVPRSVLVENPHMQAWMTANVRADSTVALAPPGVDTDVFAPAAPTTQRDYLLFVGRMSDPRKNVSGLLRAYALYRGRTSDPKPLVLAGRTRPTDADDHLIDTLGLRAHVDVRGPLALEELIDAYHGAALFVSASEEEGLGLTFVEALACGVPVVARVNDGAEAVVRDGVGTVVPGGPDADVRLAEAMAAWHETTDDVRASCRRRAVSVFSIAATEGAYYRAIERAAAAGEKASRGQGRS